MARKTPASKPAQRIPSEEEIRKRQDILEEAHKRIPKPENLWMASLQTAAIPRTRKEAMNVRVDVPIKRSLESMAALLGKTPSNLAAEILRAATVDFSDRLVRARPDLMEEVGDGDEIPTWLWPQQAYFQYLAENPESMQPTEDE